MARSGFGQYDESPVPQAFGIDVISAFPVALRIVPGLCIHPRHVEVDFEGRSRIIRDQMPIEVSDEVIAQPMSGRGDLFG